MIEYAGVLYDVDNTLYCNGHKVVHETARRTVNQLGKKGIPATARSIPLMRSLERHGVAIGGVGVLDSGATIYGFSEHEILEKKWLNRNQVTEILRKVGGYCASISVATLKKRVKFDPSEFDNSFRYDQESPTAFGVYELDRRLDIESRLATIVGVSARFMRFDNSTTQGCFQVTREGINKGAGARRAVKLLGLESARLVAIGDDSPGDGPLFDAVKAMSEHNITIAMGNSDSELLKMADWRVPGIDDKPDGFTVAMKKLQLVS